MRSTILLKLNTFDYICFHVQDIRACDEFAFLLSLRSPSVWKPHDVQKIERTFFPLLWVEWVLDFPRYQRRHDYEITVFFFGFHSLWEKRSKWMMFIKVMGVKLKLLLNSSNYISSQNKKHNEICFRSSTVIYVINWNRVEFSFSIVSLMSEFVIIWSRYKNLRPVLCCV